MSANDMPDTGRLENIEFTLNQILELLAKWHDEWKEENKRRERRERKR